MQKQATSKKIESSFNFQLLYWFQIFILHRNNATKTNKSKMIKFLLVAAFLAVSSAFAPTASFVQTTNNLQKQSALYMVQGQGNSYKKVFVAGASKGVGRSVLNKLLGSGKEVVALVRSDETFDELSSLDGVTAIKGDAMDYKTVEGAMDGCDAAISTLGGAPPGEDGKWGKTALNAYCIEVNCTHSPTFALFSRLRWQQ